MASAPSCLLPWPPPPRRLHGCVDDAIQNLSAVTALAVCPQHPSCRLRLRAGAAGQRGSPGPGTPRGGVQTEGGPPRPPSPEGPLQDVRPVEVTAPHTGSLSRMFRPLGNLYT